MAGPAPLISTAVAPAPHGGRAEWFEGAGGAQLRAAIFPAADPCGSVVLSPGRTEPLEKYFETIEDLLARRFTVLCHDWRGQGLSHRLLPDRLRGHADRLDDFVLDHAALLDNFGRQLPRPWFAFAHSMGACLVLLALARGEDRFRAALMTAPMLGILTPLPAIIVRPIADLMLKAGGAGRYAMKPYDPLGESFDGNDLTHDRRRYARYKAQLRAHPDLALGSPTWGWLAMGLQAGAELAGPGVLERVKIPTTLVAAGDERLVRNSVSRAAARRLAHGRYVEVEGARHELLMESDRVRERVLEEFDRLTG